MLLMVVALLDFRAKMSKEKSPRLSAVRTNTRATGALSSILIRSRSYDVFLRPMNRREYACF
jgi:hypothetical protein